MERGMDVSFGVFVFCVCVGCDACVLFSARVAVERGYDVLLRCFVWGFGTAWPPNPLRVVCWDHLGQWM